eukprot:1582874-Pleurochrysis_carterae.AAC.4
MAPEPPRTLRAARASARGPPALRLQASPQATAPAVERAVAAPAACAAAGPGGGHHRHVRRTGGRGRAAAARSPCFVWWRADRSAGVIVDRRMGFSGAYAPNRFERISTLVAAWVQTWVQTKQATAFDAQRPLPAAARAWRDRRARAQHAGILRAGEEQLAPIYLQVYIDDFTGVAIDDEVELPPSVAGREIDPVLTIADGGGAPASATSRACVHSKLAALGLSELGLHAAPTKVVVGDPVTALGMSVGVRGDRLQCREGKQALLLPSIAEAKEEALQRARAS